MAWSKGSPLYLEELRNLVNNSTDTFVLCGCEDFEGIVGCRKQKKGVASGDKERYEGECYGTRLACQDWCKGMTLLSRTSVHAMKTVRCPYHMMNSDERFVQRGSKRLCSIHSDGKATRHA